MFTDIFTQLCSYTTAALQGGATFVSGTVHELWGPREALLMEEARGSVSASRWFRTPTNTRLGKFPCSLIQSSACLPGTCEELMGLALPEPETKKKNQQKNNRPKKDFTNPQGLKQKEIFSATARLPAGLLTNAGGIFLSLIQPLGSSSQRGQLSWDCTSRPGIMALIWTTGF